MLFNQSLSPAAAVSVLKSAGIQNPRIEFTRVIKQYSIRQVMLGDTLDYVLLKSDNGKFWVIMLETEDRFQTIKDVEGDVGEMNDYITVREPSSFTEDFYIQVPK